MTIKCGISVYPSFYNLLNHRPSLLGNPNEIWGKGTFQSILAEETRSNLFYCTLIIRTIEHAFVTPILIEVTQGFSARTFSFSIATITLLTNLLFLPLFQKMRLFQKSLDDLSNRLSAAESVKNTWTSVSDASQIPELREYLKVSPSRWGMDIEDILKLR